LLDSITANLTARFQIVMVCAEEVQILFRVLSALRLLKQVIVLEKRQATENTTESALLPHAVLDRLWD